jgi:hypothetical protein
MGYRRPHQWRRPTRAWQSNEMPEDDRSPAHHGVPDPVLTAHQWADHGVTQLTWLTFATTGGLGFVMRTQVE